MSRDNTYLVDILESAKIALDYVFDKDWDTFYTDIQVWDTVQNKLPPLIEELSKIVPPE